MVAFPDCAVDAAAASVALARNLAEQGKRVVVVDISESPHDLNQAAMLEPGAGLAELLNGQATFSNAIVRDQEPWKHAKTA